MKKRLVSVLLVVVMILSMSTTCIFAAENNKSKELIAAERIVDDCNAVIECLVKNAQRTRIYDVPLLLIEVEVVAAAAKIAVKLLGFGVECIYTEYKVDGRNVMIDPLRVVTPIDSGSGHR